MPGLARTEISSPLEPRDTAAERDVPDGGLARVPLRFLFATAETHPTHRADVRVLFGKYLPAFGIRTDLLATSRASVGTAPWGGGRCLVWRARTRLGLLLADVGQQLTLFGRCFQGYDGLIARDKPILGLVGLAAARLARIPFVYWMSFPMPEAYLEISRDATVGWPRRAYAGVRGRLGSWALRRLVLPYADHLFVQSPVMLEELLERGLGHLRVTPVPMGVDVDAMPEPRGRQGAQGDASGHRRSAVYLGTLSRLRQHELQLMIDAAMAVGQVLPDFELLVIGESDTESERGWLSRYASERGADRWVRFTGWLPYDEGLALASACSVGLSPFPRGHLFESASPTKAIEYLALGLPVVCNDQPDQAYVVARSGGGLCVDLTAEAFADAIRQLLEDPERAHAMGQAGRRWVRENRDYRSLASTVAGTLRALGRHGRAAVR